MWDFLAHQISKGSADLSLAECRLQIVCDYPDCQISTGSKVFVDFLVADKFSKKSSHKFFMVALSVAGVV